MKFRSIGRAAINHQKPPERIKAPVPLPPFAPSRLRARFQSKNYAPTEGPEAFPPKAKAAKPTPNPAPNRFPVIRPRASVVECGMKFRSIGRAAINH